MVVFFLISFSGCHVTLRCCRRHKLYIYVFLLVKKEQKWNICLMIALEIYPESKKVFFSFFMFVLHLQVIWITLNMTNS